MPDTLATWKLTAFSIDPINGLVLTETPIELCVKKPISLNLPYLVKRDEVITIPCTISNLSQSQAEFKVIFENKNNEFEFMDWAVDNKIYPESKKNAFREKILKIPSNVTDDVLFTIRPTKVGLISLKVSAITQTTNNCVVETLNVECEGVPQFVNKALFIDLREKSQIETIDIDIEIPKTALSDSTCIEITCSGDLFAGTIRNLESLVRRPCGCGEQNILHMVPNIIVLNYLKITQQLTVEIEAKAKKFITIGYQRQLRYKHKDGSFSDFGASDKSGCTWLTAFVARSFQQASEHISIQDGIIDKALNWLSKLQSWDGSFLEKGQVSHGEMQAKSSNTIALTAYVLTTFLMNKVWNQNYNIIFFLK